MCVCVLMCGNPHLFVLEKKIGRHLRSCFFLAFNSIYFVSFSLNGRSLKKILHAKENDEEKKIDLVGLFLTDLILSQRNNS